MKNINIYNELITKAHKLRQDTFKAFIEYGEAHLGGSFSIIEILTALYEVIIKKDDKFILSKSHASYPLCIILNEKGFDIPLTTHLELNPENGIHCTTGSLGHGFPISAGMALARKRQGATGKIFVLISDGECQEGTTWETMLICSKEKLSNLILIIDYNKIQALTTLEEGLPLKSLSNKIESFNWNCIEVDDGHSFNEIFDAFNSLQLNGKPTAIILHTVKGKGIKSFENDPGWHARKVKGDDLITGKKELGMN